MTTQTDALKLALESLENHSGNYKLSKAECAKHEIVIATIKEALAQPEQEPVHFDAIIADIEAISCHYRGDPSHEHCPYKIRSESADVVRRHASYYISPPQRPWVGLTDEEHMILYTKANSGLHDWAIAIEAKLKQKNS